MTLTKKKGSKAIVRACSDEMESAWDEFVAQNESATVFHRFGWKRIFERAYGNECAYLMAEEDGCPVGILPLVQKKSFFFGRFLVSLPYFDYAGICSERDDARTVLLESAKELARQNGADYLELRHDRQDGLDLLTKRSKVSMLLELPPDPEQLWTGLKAKVRNQVRKAEKADLSAVEGGKELLEGFFETYAANMRDLGSPSHSRDFFVKVCDTYPDLVRIFSVMLGKKPVASGFTIASKNMLTIPWASSLREFNSMCPNMLLYWTVLKHACASGFSRFSFGRSTVDEGTYRFKKQWGAAPQQLFWQYWLSNGDDMPELNTENSKYQLYVRAWKNMPVAVTKRLGPKLIQHLP